MVDGRQRLARPGRVGGRLVPAHAGDRVVLLSLGIVARLPGRGPRPAGAISEALHRLFPGEPAPRVDEGLLPGIALPVAALLDELAVLAVGHLVPVDEGLRLRHLAGNDVLQTHERQPEHFAAGDCDHSWRHVALAKQVRGELHPVGAIAPLPAFRGDVAGFRQAQLAGQDRDPRARERRDAQGAPGRVVCTIEPSLHDGAGRIRLDIDEPRHLRPQPGERRLRRNHLLHFEGHRQGLGELARVREPHRFVEL